ncbi:MATE family efflux transporter [Massiliimalia timonensis]|uniref:MATE family efflux transporter n=1 Tax=Massiliimalia timonensis TaxID=1987501 RepID=UPI00189FFFE6|nr:MATE family efflux transporter [Massiliimalia timonensis]
MKRSYEIDMCNGPLLGKLLRFAIPLMFSSILQLLFNAADIVVVGQFTGSQALAAVGSTSSLNNLIINIFMGLSIGSNVIMAQDYGAQHWDEVHDDVHTSMLLSAVSGVILIFLGILLAEPMLQLMGTPDDVLDQSVLYMRIIFVGMPAFMIYNFGAALLRAVGDTRRPLIFLLIAGVLNVLLNLFFVIVWNMGVAGVALATIISQALSAALVVMCLIQDHGYYHLSIRELRIKKKKFLSIVRVGLPAGIQGAVFGISNVTVQSSVNSFGSLVMAGHTASSNIQGFVYNAMCAFYQASLSFTSQNVGAQKPKRVLAVLGRCMACTSAVGLVLGGLAVLFGPQLLSIYSPDPDIVPFGMQNLYVLCLTYYLCGMMDVACGAIRGLGYSVTPTIVSLAGACGVRVLWIYTAFAANRSLFMLYLSYPVSWAVALLGHLICFIIFFHRWKKKAGTVSPQESERSSNI